MGYAGSICSYVSSQKEEFIIFGYPRLLCVYLMALVLEESICGKVAKFLNFKVDDKLISNILTYHQHITNRKKYYILESI